MRQILGRIGLAAFALALAASAPAWAQESAGGAAQPAQKLQDAARKAYKAIADNNIDLLRTVTEKRPGKKLTNDSLRPAATGPKISVAWDGNVKVLLQSGKDAVVTANFFKPESSDLPAPEVSGLRLYLVDDHGEWKVATPNKKEAGTDADQGGWYHSGSFTLCPNKGIVFLPNHFSSKTECAATAVCR